MVEDSKKGIKTANFINIYTNIYIYEYIYIYMYILYI